MRVFNNDDLIRVLNFLETLKIEFFSYMKITNNILVLYFFLVLFLDKEKKIYIVHLYNYLKLAIKNFEY